MNNKIEYIHSQIKINDGTRWDTVIIGRFFILLSILFFCMLPFAAQAAAQTVEEFVNALIPENGRDEKRLLKGENSTTKIRGYGGMRTLPEKPKITLHLQFDLNSHELKPDAIITLNKLIMALQNESLRRYVFRIEGHTGDLGTKAYNMALSQRHTMAVRSYIDANSNLEYNQFEVAWFGEERPAVLNTGEPARQKNRRVVITNTLKSFDLPINSQQSAVLQIKNLSNGQEQIVQDGDALDENDRYAVEFKAGVMQYVYIYQIDADGNAKRLFPNGDYTQLENPLAPNRIYRVPSKMRWFYLDDNKGKEKIILLAGHQPVSDPQKICMRVADEKYVSQKTRGFGGIHKDKTETESSPNRVKSIPGPLDNLVTVSRYFYHH